VKAILRKILFGLIAASALAVATGVLVVAAAYALFALVREPLGAAGAAGVVALAAAVLIAFVGLVFALLARPAPRRARVEEEQDLLQRLMSLARERPIVSVSALIGAVTLAIRNPALITIVMKAFLDPKSRPQNKKAKS
jgi:hypothetical protein